MPSRTRRTALALLALCSLVITTVVSAPPVSAAGRTLHVSPDGQDRDRYVCHIGTADQPWNNLSDAFRCLQPGDTLHVHAGTYTERVTFGGTPATEEQPILVTGAPGEDRPVIRGGMRIEDPTWWTIQDLEVVGDGQDYGNGAHPLKLLGGAHWTVQRVELHHAAAYALLRITPTSNGTSPSNWRVIDSCFHDTIPAHGSPDAPPYPDHNLYVWTGNGAGLGLIERNIMFGAPNGQNVKLGNVDGQGADDSADNVTVRHNTMVDAAQNVTVVGPSDNNLIERNLLAEVNYGESWYPNVRGIYLSGQDNVARDNAWSGAPEVVRNQTGVTTGVIDGGNRRVSAGFDERGCDGFLPTDAAAASYGAHAQELADIEIPVERVAGEDRLETAVKVSREVHGVADTVILTRADAYPDALASSALAGLRRVPVLLTPRDGVPPVVLDEIRRLGADAAVLLGGQAALGDGVEADLRAAGLRDVRRLAGANRFATATRVADEVRALRASGTTPDVVAPENELILVEGVNADPARGWPDAVSAGQLAAASGSPVLLTDATSLPEDTRRWLAVHQPDVVTIVGGTVAVSGAVAREVDELVGRVQRLAGPDRYTTAERVAEELTARRGSDIPPDRTFVASGRSFPDAMAVGPAAALAGGVVVLYGSGEESYQRLREFVAPVDDADLLVTVVGGPVAVPGTLEQRWKLDAAAAG